MHNIGICTKEINISVPRTLVFDDDWFGDSFSKQWSTNIVWDVGAALFPHNIAMLLFLQYFQCFQTDIKWNWNWFVPSNMRARS